MKTQDKSDAKKENNIESKLKKETEVKTESKKSVVKPATKIDV